MCPPSSETQAPLPGSVERSDPAVQSLTLQDIRKQIPQECFAKETSRSLYYLARDLGVLATAPFVYPHVAALANPLVYLAYWNFYGFFMWCLFVVGHDCGHTTFSPSKLLNDVCG
jgi:omega-3 fatty acid desaturase (delta-15 desaturase)